MSTPKNELAPDDPRHGTTNGYSNLNCRCDKCRAAWRAYIKGVKSRRTPPPPGDPRHGKYTTYGNYGCKCEPCTTAWNERSKSWKLNRKKAEKADSTV